MSLTSVNSSAHPGRIPAPNELFGREYELDFIRRYLTNGMNCQIVGPPGIGKTSLLYNLQFLAPQWDPAFTVGYLDLQDPPCETVEDFWKRAGAAWAGQPGVSSAAALEEHIADWRQRGRRPVLCLDGFEALTNRSMEFTTYFYLDMRGLANQGLIFVTAARQKMSELHVPYRPTSPFFNVFAILSLGPLQEKDAADFVTLSCPSGQSFTPEEKAVILQFAKGYPLALQIACSRVLEAKESGESLSTVLQKAADEAKPHLPEWW